MNTSKNDRKKHPAFNLLKLAARLFYPRHTVLGLENLQKDSPAVFICNHAESYAPIVMELYFPFKFRPWVIYQNFTRELCRDYIETDFISKELKLKRPLSRWLASAVASPCVWVMEAVQAIPVYKGNMRIRETFELSMEAIRQGDNIVIFPENPEKKFSESVYDFYNGFVQLARLYYKEAGKTLYFYPVFIGSGKRTITIGKPVGFSPENSFSKEKEYIRVYLRDSINDISAASRR
jgi:1-acyl-sn-glycerol-3-phosphate acyltransferase